MSTDLQVVNRALRHLGQFPIENLAGNTSGVSRAMKDCLDSSIRTVLGLYNWTANRKTHRSTGTLTDPPDGKWRYRHDLPGLPDAMVVEGAGTTAVNGTYLRDGDSGGNPRYTLVGGTTGNDSILGGDSGWVIINNESSFYSTAEAAATPDLVETWTPDDGIAVRYATWADIDAAGIDRSTVPLIGNIVRMDTLLSVRGSDGGYTTDFQVVGDYLEVNDEAITITYTTVIDTVSEMPEYLASLIAAHLAMESCMVITGDGNKYYVMERIYSRELNRARAQELRMNPHGVEWMDSSNSSFLRAHQGLSST